MTGEIGNTPACIGHATRGGKRSEVGAPTRTLTREQDEIISLAVQFQNQVYKMLVAMQNRYQIKD